MTPTNAPPRQGGAITDAIARAIAESHPTHLGLPTKWDKLHEEEREPYRDIARAAISAMRAATDEQER